MSVSDPIANRSSRSGIDRSAMRVKEKGFAFEPFRVAGAGAVLADLAPDPDYELIVFERGGEQRALSAREMSYHHVAQGTLAGQPYLVSF